MRPASRLNTALRVWPVQDGVIDWFALRDEAYVPRSPDEDGIIESEVFAGLRLDVNAMLAGDRDQVLAAAGNLT